jgi:Protein of unknown function (DUF3551)
MTLEVPMRIFLVGLAILTAALALDVPPSSAERGQAARRIHPFCVEGGFRGGGRDCLYWTLAQCRASARGRGYCIDNPAIGWEALRQGKPLPPPSKEWNYQ